MQHELISSTGYRGPEVETWGMRCRLRRVRGARKRLVGAGNWNGVVDLLAGSGTEVLLLLFSWNFGHERTALVLFWHRR